MAKPQRNETSVVVVREIVHRREHAKRLLTMARDYQRLSVSLQAQIDANRPVMLPPLEMAKAHALGCASTLRESARLIVKDAE